MSSKLLSVLMLVVAAFTWGCDDDYDLPEPTAFRKQVVATNLQAPIGLAIDNRGRFWVSEAGTGQQDARVIIITETGARYTAFTGFSSVIANGGPEGIGHVVYKTGTLYILDGGAGKLYIVDVSAYQPGDPVRTAQQLNGIDIKTYVLSQQLSIPIDSNIYNLLVGPDGNLYIADAGANAIIKRDQGTGALSVFARFPNITPTIQPVPTNIVYDGSKYLVSTLTGFPFLPGVAKIFQVDLTGQVSEYRGGFTTLTDIVLTPNKKPLVLQYARFSLMPPTVGFQRFTGRVADENGMTLADSLDRPTDIERFGIRTYYALSSGAGTITKLTQ